MQVADHQQLTTSATLGGKQAISFGISDDPAFFHVLSTSLYNNPNLAVVRETICNQWDAHIEAGKTHLPVLITIDEDNFITFRDYGNGIPSDKIGAIYATYGASTKKANSSVTGGFGLGCKSPFAYTDSFQVTSWNQGKMSIYNVTKSSVETDGKPGVIPIITDIASDDTGLEVKFQLRKEDVNEFIGYIESIVYNGEIKAILRRPILVSNSDGTRSVEVRDKMLPVLGMPFEPGSYDMSSGWHRPYMGNSAVYVRYGNVMYPAIESPATEEAMEVIQNFMYIIGANRIVVQAAPSTLAIAPSRETLSNQKMTDDGIVDICVDLVERLEKEIKAGLPLALKEIKEGIASNSDCNIEYREDYFNYVSNNRVKGYMKSSLWRKTAIHYLKYWNNLSDKRFFEQEEFKGVKFHYGKAMIALKAARGRRQSKPFTDFLQRHIVLPVSAKWKIEGLKWSGHIVGRYNHCMLVKAGLQYYMKSYGGLEVLQTLITKNVVITKRFSDCNDSFYFYPEYHGSAWDAKREENNGIFATKTAHVIHVGAKKGEAEKVSAKYTAMGYNVIDLTQNHEWDKPAKMRRDAAAYANAKRAKNKAALLAAGMEGSEPNRLISINCVLGKRNGIDRETKKIYEFDYIDTDFAAPEKWKECGHVDVENPVYYVELKEIRSGRPEHNPDVGYMHQWSNLTDEVKAVTVVCRNKIEVNKVIKRGAVHLDDKRYMEVMDIIKSKEFKKYATEQRIGVLEYLGMEDGSYQELLKLLGIKSKVLENLVLKPEFEWVYRFLNCMDYNKREKLISLGCITEADEVNQYRSLTHLSSFKHLQALYDLKGIFSCENVGGSWLFYSEPRKLIEWLKKHPEDIPGYKILIRNCLTKRKGIYTR